MSSLWTPGGERPVARDPRPEPSGAAGGPGPGPGDGERELTPEEMQAEMEALREQLAATPAEVVVANHAYGLFELAALHLSVNPPQLSEGRLAIDALALLVEGLGDRLGEPARELEAALAQLRMAFVQLQAAVRAASGEAPEPPDPTAAG